MRRQTLRVRSWTFGVTHDALDFGLYDRQNQTIDLTHTAMHIRCHMLSVRCLTLDVPHSECGVGLENPELGLTTQYFSLTT